jgi:D-threo-aldose 1-dehydrogenase
MDIDNFVFGCGPIGSFALDGDAEAGGAALRAALEAGVTRFDAAPSYGGGCAELLLGAALAQWAGERGDHPMPIVSTKVGRTAMAHANPYARPVGRDAPSGGGVFDFTADGVRAALAASLNRLGRDRVDTVYLHDPELAPTLVRTEAIPALREIRDAGVVDAIGVATTNPSAALALVEAGGLDCVMIAAAWSLTRRAARPLLDRCAELDVPVLAAAPFDSGLLATDRPDPSAPSGYRTADAEDLARAAGLAECCARYGVRLPQAALHFPLRHPAVTGVVVRMRSTIELAADLQMLAATPPDELWDELDSVVAGR